uniref:Endoplasmic reticulum transmembrane protein n=1 Tax=Globodera pallida TaxID=36090 RepID=A0A183BL87_GLOPA
MTLQWTVIAFVLYSEIATIVVLLLPWIRPTMWKKVFNSRILHKLKQFSTVYSYSFIFVLILLFIDATREVRKYSHVDASKELTGRVAEADAVIHMRLFSIISRIVTLLARCAHLELAAEAAMKQAEGAGKAAQSFIDKDGNAEGLSAGEANKLRGDLKETKEKLNKAETDRDTMKTQAENLQEEYERVTEQLRATETSHGRDKKSD